MIEQHVQRRGGRVGLDGPFPEAPPKAPPSRPQQLLELARLVTRAALGGVGLLSAHGELLEHVTTGLPDLAGTSPPRRPPWPVEMLQVILCQPGPVLRSGWPVLVPPGLPTPTSFLALPIHCPGRCRGAIYLGRVRGEPPFSATDAEAVQAIGGFLEQGGLFEEARLLARVRLLSGVAQAAAGSLDLARILRVGLRELDRQLPLQVCAAWLLEEGPEPDGTAVPADPALLGAGGPSLLHLVDSTAGVGHRDEGAGGFLPGLRLALEETPFADCVRHGQPFYVDLADDLGDRAHARGQVVRLGADRASCCIAMPLRAGDRTVGVLQSVCLRSGGFTSEQVEILSLVADLLGPSISSCQLFGRLRSAYEALRVTQEQLIHAEKMRALGELAGGMAHEFNNALCGALGFLELALLQPELAVPTRRHLESARICAVDAAQTVRRVQEFARWKPNHAPVETLDLNALVQEGVALIRHRWEDLAHARGGPIVVGLDTRATARVAGNATELREVLANLAFNAVDAMPNGGALTVRTWSRDEAVYLSVQDTGVGIPEAVRHRLFEPFFTTKGERGNGLGLSVTFGIVRRHGGEITVESGPGRGATFVVRLPAVAALERGAAVERRTPDAERPTAGPDGGGRSGLRILVVEDEESIRRFLAAGLEGLGHHPRLAGDAEEARAALAEESFDLVLTDLGLPGASGEEVARMARARLPGVPVVVLTGWADQLQAEAVALADVSRLLSKPISLATLADTLAELCP